MSLLEVLKEHFADMASSLDNVAIALISANCAFEANEEQHDSVTESHLALLKEKKFCDVTFTFRKFPDRIQAHQLYLRARSPVFNVMFRDRVSGEEPEVKLVDTTPARFQQFLEFVYADKLEVDKVGALDLLQLGKKFRVQPLIKKCEAILETEINAEDAVEIFEAAMGHKHDQLMQRAGDVLVRSLPVLLETEKFIGIKEETLVYLLKREDLTVREVELFKYSIKWGKDELRIEGEESEEKLLEVLSKVLPLIRFTNMTPHEFTSVVLPLKLLPSEDVIDVYTYFGSSKEDREQLASRFKFSVAPRESVATDRMLDLCVRKVVDKTSGIPMARQGNKPLKQCVSFQVSISSTRVDRSVWDENLVKRPAITGINVRWPSRWISQSYGDYTSYNVNFKITIYWCTRALSADGIVAKFEHEVRGCVREQLKQTELQVDLPVELIDGLMYCITAEDLSTHFERRRSEDKEVEYLYWPDPDVTGLVVESLVQLESWNVQLLNIKKDFSLDGFSEQPYEESRVVQGIRIGLA